MPTHDVFISHASEDKAGFVEPLVAALRDRGVSVWYDRTALKLGDDLRQSIDRGLREARYGVVVLSPAFLGKRWPEMELSALFALEQDGRKRILPIRHRLSHAELTASSPLLGSRLTADDERGIPSLVDQIISVLENSAPPNPRSLSSLVGVPRGSQFFTGREDDISRIEQLITDADLAVDVAIEGLPGIGKTELAIQLAHRVARRGLFPGGVYWLDAEASDLTATWDRIGALMGITASADRPSVAVRTVSGKNVPVLLILDNVARWKPLSPLPNGVHVRCVATSRELGGGGTQFHHHVVDVLDSSTSRALFSRIVGREVPGAEPLLDYLGGHTLAVELAASWLQDPERDAVDYLRRLVAGADPSEQISDRVRYERTVRQALSILWAGMDQDDQLSWATMGCLAPGPVTSSLLDACGIDSERRAALRRKFVLRAEGEGRWGLHRLVRDFANRLADANAGRKAHAGVVSCAKSFDPVTGHVAYLRDRAHFDALLSSSPNANPEAGIAWIGYAMRVAAAQRAGGDYASARALLERALIVACRAPTERSRWESTLRSNLSTVLENLGDYSRAKAEIERAIELDTKQLGSEHPRVIEQRSTLGMIVRAMGRPRDARVHIEAALESVLLQYPPDHPFVATRRANLAVVLKDLGEYQLARQQYEAAIASDVRAYGEEHPKVAAERANLGFVLGHLKEYSAAEEQLRGALSVQLRIQGADHPDVATTRFFLSTVCRSLGRLSEARELLAAAIESDVRTHGVNHPQVIARRSEFANVLRADGDLESARSQLVEALAASERVYSAQHPRTSNLRSNLGVVLQGLGEHYAARIHFEDALASDLHSFGRDHPNVALRRANLAAAMRRLGELDGALDQAREARRVALLLPEDSPSRKAILDATRDAAGAEMTE